MGIVLFFLKKDLEKNAKKDAARAPLTGLG